MLFTFHIKGGRNDDQDLSSTASRKVIFAESIEDMGGDSQAELLYNMASNIPEGMWEAAMTLNDHWGYHKGDTNWKSAGAVARMLQQVAAGAGNLLLNVGPTGDGSIPPASARILDEVGEWLRVNGEAVYDTERFDFNLRERGNERADWNPHGVFTARGNAFYFHVNAWPGSTLTIAGLECTVTEVTHLADGRRYDFDQQDGRIVVTGLPDTLDTTMPVVLRFRTSDTPCLYLTGGQRTPTVAHCHYDPMPSDILH